MDSWAPGCEKSVGLGWTHLNHIKEMLCSSDMQICMVSLAAKA